MVPKIARAISTQWENSYPPQPSTTFRVKILEGKTPEEFKKFADDPNLMFYYKNNDIIDESAEPDGSDSDDLLLFFHDRIYTFCKSCELPLGTAYELFASYMIVKKAEAFDIKRGYSFPPISERKAWERALDNTRFLNPDLIELSLTVGGETYLMQRFPSIPQNDMARLLKGLSASYQDILLSKRFFS